MVPVDHVAHCATLAAVHSLPRNAVSVLQVTSRPPVTYNDLLEPLSQYGYPVEKCEYVVWRQKLEQHVLDVQDNALFPLLHFVLDDLPTSTKSAVIDDSNMALLLGTQERQAVTVTGELIGKYLSWLVGATFLPRPTGQARLALPNASVSSVGTRAVGRSGRM